MVGPGRTPQWAIAERQASVCRGRNREVGLVSSNSVGSPVKVRGIKHVERAMSGEVISQIPVWLSHIGRDHTEVCGVNFQ